jgi:hypothetical protein
MTRMRMTFWWMTPSGAWSGTHWYGPKQLEDKSPENIQRCYQWLRGQPYLSAEDQERLQELEHIAVTEAVITASP